MIPGALLTWALVALSLFNTILLLWLGITLSLNADRRSPGVIVTAAGFGLGSALFISHCALLLSESLQLTRSTTLWLAAGSAPAVLLPYVWHVVLLWYSGYWTLPRGAFQRRHRPWLWLVTGILVGGIACLAVLGLPFLPVVGRLSPLLWPVRELVKTSYRGIPLVALGYPLYVILCVVLSLDALRRPGLTGRTSGEAARRKAQPWLIAASVLLVGVGSDVAAVLVWTVLNTKVGGYYLLTPASLEVIGGFDLVACLLIAGVTTLLGQAVTAYELFTGKVLPRQGLARQWRQALWLAGGYGVAMGGSLVWGLEPVYAILLTALLMTAFFALLGWRSFSDWEQAMRRLRPFVASQRWYDALLAPSSSEAKCSDPFHALCRELLCTTVAHLIPLGPTASLVAPRSYPEGASTPAAAASALAPEALSDSALVAPIDAARYEGATWAVPLCREQGLIGALLFGPRRDGSLYTQEEIEIAQSTGERLLDGAASLALSQRLMQLQRERMASTQVLDQRTRRVLHDEVLPLIHTALLTLSTGSPPDAALQHLSSAHTQVSELLRGLPPTVAPEIARLGLLAALRRAVDVEFASAFDEVAWLLDEAAQEQAVSLNPLAADTVYFAAREVVRNAAKHARPAGQAGALRLEIGARLSEGQFLLSIEDNGAGLPPEPGAGQGLALHSTLMAVVGGSLSLDTTPGLRTRVLLAVPLP